MNDVIHNENKKLKEENENLKSVPYEFIRDNGEKEYYNLFTHKLVKKIDKDNTIWEYDKNNGLLLKKTDKDNNVEEYGSHGKLIKRKTIDGSIEEFDDNEEKFKEIDKNGKVKIFKTKLYQNISDFKKLNFTIRQLKDIGFSLQELKDAGYTLHQFISVGYTEKELKDAGYTAKEINKITKPNQEIYYRKDGKTIKVIEKLNPEGKIIQRIYYNPDGTVKEVINPKS